MIQPILGWNINDDVDIGDIDVEPEHAHIEPDRYYVQKKILTAVISGLTFFYLPEDLQLSYLLGFQVGAPMGVINALHKASFPIDYIGDLFISVFIITELCCLISQQPSFFQAGANLLGLVLAWFIFNIAHAADVHEALAPLNMP